MFRIVKITNILFRIQQKGFLWGWNDVTDLAGCPIDFKSAKSAIKFISDHTEKRIVVA